MNWLPKRLPCVATATLAVLVNLLVAGSASAHVKWFCAFNVAGQPRGLENVLCPDFEFLAGLSLLILIAGCLIARHAGRRCHPACHGPRDRAARRATIRS